MAQTRTLPGMPQVPAAHPDPRHRSTTSEPANRSTPSTAASARTARTNASSTSTAEASTRPSASGTTTPATIKGTNNEKHHLRHTYRHHPSPSAPRSQDAGARPRRRPRPTPSPPPAPHAPNPAATSRNASSHCPTRGSGLRRLLGLPEGRPVMRLEPCERCRQRATVKIWSQCGAVCIAPEDDEEKEQQ